MILRARRIELRNLLAIDELIECKIGFSVHPHFSIEHWKIVFHIASGSNGAERIRQYMLYGITLSITLFFMRKCNKTTSTNTSNRIDVDTIHNVIHSSDSARYTLLNRSLHFSCFQQRSASTKTPDLISVHYRSLSQQ